MSEVCKDTKTESKITSLFAEELQGRTSNNSIEAMDIRTLVFWEPRQQAFFDLRVVDPSTCRHRN